MSGRTPTPEQQAAIDAEGEILISASAGSGKTFVMIEKIISLILSGKADVDSILAVTFTNLAASEMKERLRGALCARISQETDESRRAHLKAQLAEVASADISTLHSFCMNVIRRFFYAGGMDGNFRVAEPVETEKLKRRALSAALEEAAQSPSENFLLLARIFASGRGFSRLGEIVLKAYEKMIVRADYTTFLREIPDFYDETHFFLLEREAFAPMQRQAQKLETECEKLETELKAMKGCGLFNEKHAAFVAQRRAFAREILQAKDVFSASRRIKEFAFSSKPTNAKLKNAGNEDAMALDNRLAALKTRVDALKKSAVQYGEREQERERFFASGKVAAALCELLLAFDERFLQLKRRAGVLDFSDLEQKCLALLEIPSVCEAVKGRYTHIFVDEYQDVNPAQEKILSLIAGKNVFMVGDVKQSIYGFRGCSASFFAEKYDALAKEGRALTLNGNFRSDREVLESVNALFCGVMTRENGSVDYAETSMMSAGSERQTGGKVRFAFVPQAEEKEKQPRGVYSVMEHIGQAEEEEYAEGALIASVLLQEAEQERIDAETGEAVRFGFGDMVVLTRGKTEKAERIVNELVRRGIPVCASAEVNICDYPEIKTLLSILQYLDNGLQDIPLAAALKSPMGNVSDEELAKIRLFCTKKDTGFCSVCEEYVQKNSDTLQEKLRAFFAYADELRLLMQVKSAAQILTKLLSDTGMELSLLASPCGAEKMRRVNRLIAECGERSVGEFLERLKSGGNEIGFSESGGEDAVRVMTMHASKGLEFPVVVVAGMNNRFSGEDLKGILFDDEWGFATLAYDTKEYTSSETLLRSVVRARLRRKRAEDEMRLFYVAVTRAKHALYLVFTEEKPFDEEAVSDASCFADFVDLEKFRDLYASVYENVVEPPKMRVLSVNEPDEEVKRAVLSTYAAPYAHAESVGLRLKTSPSALLSAEGEAEPQEMRAADEGYETPADAQTGILYHAALERARFGEEPAAEAKRLKLSLQGEEGGENLSEEKLAEILNMPVFQTLDGFTLYREQPFLLSLAAKTLYGGESRDEVLVQGVMDLMAIRGDTCLIVDYKYSSLGKGHLLQKYKTQLKIYAAAARRIPGIRTVSARIVNILRGYETEVPQEYLQEE